MRSRIRDVPAGAGADFGIACGLVGVGEAVEGRPRSLPEAILAVAQAHGEKAGRMVARFAGVPEDSFVWTRQLDGAYRLGRIRDAWRYDDSPAAREVGIHHVRRTVWSPLRFTDDHVPQAVACTFARGGRNFQRTHDEKAERQTFDAWQRNAEGPPLKRSLQTH